LFSLEMATAFDTAICVTAEEADEVKILKHSRRFCRMTGCSSIVKSQGLCQRHGAKPRMCKVTRCSKQAQGNFDGMCKSHFKAQKRATTPLPVRPPAARVPPPPEGVSVYDRIIPASLQWKPNAGLTMPLVKHLRDGFEHPHKPPAWHRNEERRARGLWPVSNPATQLEGWERELVWMEILLLTGNPDASFRHLARGWGRDKGFHTVLAQFICERHGNVDRKKRQKRDGTKHDFGASADKNVAERDMDDMDEMGVAGLGLFDDAFCGDVAYNEALEADLLTFESPQRQGRMFSFEDGVVSELDEHSSDTSSDDDDVAANDYTRKASDVTAL
jgi:hypothetical protein